MTTTITSGHTTTPSHRPTALEPQKRRSSSSQLSLHALPWYVLRNTEKLTGLASSSCHTLRPRSSHHESPRPRFLPNPALLLGELAAPTQPLAQRICFTVPLGSVPGDLLTVKTPGGTVQGRGSHRGTPRLTPHQPHDGRPHRGLGQDWGRDRGVPYFDSCSWQTSQKPSESTRSHRKPSEATRSHQKPSEAIRSHQKPSEATRSHQKPSEAKSICKAL